MSPLREVPCCPCIEESTIGKSIKVAHEYIGREILSTPYVVVRMCHQYAIVDYHGKNLVHLTFCVHIEAPCTTCRIHLPQDHPCVNPQQDMVPNKIYLWSLHNSHNVTTFVKKIKEWVATQQTIQATIKDKKNDGSIEFLHSGEKESIKLHFLSRRSLRQSCYDRKFNNNFHKNILTQKQHDSNYPPCTIAGCVVAGIVNTGKLESELKSGIRSIV